MEGGEGEEGGGRASGVSRTPACLRPLTIQLKQQRVPCIDGRGGGHIQSETGRQTDRDGRMEEMCAVAKSQPGSDRKQKRRSSCNRMNRMKKAITQSMTVRVLCCCVSLSHLGQAGRRHDDDEEEEEAGWLSGGGSSRRGGREEDDDDEVSSGTHTGRQAAGGGGGDVAGLRRLLLMDGEAGRAEGGPLTD